MSHRKFERPRHGSLGFLPRKRCRRGQGRVKAFPKDDQSQPPHLTAFMGYKAGMTQVTRDIKRPGSKLNNKDVAEAATVIDCPPMIIVGVVGYIETPRGLRALSTVWAGHLSEDVRRRFYKNWYRSKKRAFTKYSSDFEKVAAGKTPEAMENALTKIKEACVAVRAIAHTQVKMTAVGQKRAHVMEIQINGGNIAQKVDFVKSLFEQQVPIDSVFKENEMIDVIGINKGHGVQGVVKRWGVTRLPRKTHRGLRKVACVGAWHPARIQFQIARHGQMGYHHRTMINKKIYRVGKAVAVDPGNASTEHDVTVKAITPMGGFPHYGTVRNDFLLLKGTVMGPRKRAITLRKSLRPVTTRRALEEPNLKFIDTSSKIGHGRFQTLEEKNSYYGPRKSKPSTQPKVAAA